MNRFTSLNHLRASVAVLALITAGISATPSFAAGPPAVAIVDITKFMFGPMELTVAPGTTVRWINHDEVPHTVTSQDKTKLFSSKAMDTNDQFEFTFANEGDYTYICTVHPFMIGTVHVKKP